MYEWNEVALNLAKDIEREIMPLFGTKKAGEFVGFSPSGDKTKLVDKIAEDIVLGYIEPLGVNVVSEEVGNIDVGSEYAVVIDPLDGSFNFIHGIPIFGFSFAVFKNKKPVYAMLYEFITKNVYEGIPREGAYLNGKKIQVRPLKENSISISFYTRGRGAKLVEKVKRTRVLGAIAVELAYLAKGSLDGVIDIRSYVRPTDIAASYVIAKEAGAIITDDKGDDIKFRLDATERLNIIAVNDKKLLELILEVI